MIRFADLLVEVSIDLDEKYQTKGDLGKWIRQKWVDISRKDPKTGKHPPCGASAGTVGQSGMLIIDSSSAANFIDASAEL